MEKLVAFDGTVIKQEEGEDDNFDIDDRVAGPLIIPYLGTLQLPPDLFAGKNPLHPDHAAAAQSKERMRLRLQATITHSNGEVLRLQAEDAFARILDQEEKARIEKEIQQANQRIEATTRLLQAIPPSDKKHASAHPDSTKDEEHIDLKPMDNIDPPAPEPATTGTAAPTDQIFCIYRSSSGYDRFMAGDQRTSTAAHVPGLPIHRPVPSVNFDDFILYDDEEDQEPNIEAPSLAPAKEAASSRKRKAEGMFRFSPGGPARS